MTPLFTDADVEEVARGIDPDAFSTKPGPKTYDWLEAQQTARDRARSALSVAAPRIVANVLRDMMEPSKTVVEAGIDTFNSGIGCFVKPVFAAMITAYARERGVEIST